MGSVGTPSTMKQWTITSTEKGFDGLQYTDAKVPEIGDNEVLVKLHAASLNFRDLAIPQGQYPMPVKTPVVAGSDGAGEVLQVGSRVTKWKQGDRVVTLFCQAHQYGPPTEEASATALGGVIDGTLRQYAVFSQDGLVRVPKNLSYNEAATLTCAGVTSWNALYGLRQLKPGQTVLVQGTGGVSLFALQFAKAAGAIVIATTSSADKAKIVKDLGADHVLNYREDKAWGETARKLSRGGQGVDQVIEVGGSSTLEQSLKAVKMEGIITIIGFLGGIEATPGTGLLQTLFHGCIVRGVYVGSKELFEDMVAAIEAGDIHPVVDKKIFKFDQVKEAYEYMKAQKHFGKLVIEIE
ncbi:zinc-binding oxidoreductase [Microdochium trichocladiopsis]|uniref:Zinc-binding oxidoreductase n=1 Tax=Microdochium trichocladiopsis TaxID=1682393 RepID=A0A9P9BPD9_9PEZI|nr:zinc-binding oxidoreductase [Microdochium trichocladiopsis]KAH7029142.1 zinc-binding oxidoreductase [Microdochium trichocladiopsis]